MSKTMSQLITEINRAEMRLIKHVKPLNDRINAMGMCVWWDGDIKEWFINNTGLSQNGISFWLDGRKYKKLMAMSDIELLEYCKNWG